MNLEINFDKTEILIFNKSGKFLKTQITYNGINVHCSKDYKYLGLAFQLSGNFTLARKDLAQRASKAIFKLTKSFSGTPPNIITCLHLFDHTIKPILLYGSEIWGGFLIDEKRDQVAN